jgi:hypothetical protein
MHSQLRQKRGDFTAWLTTREIPQRGVDSLRRGRGNDAPAGFNILLLAMRLALELHYDFKCRMTTTDILDTWPRTPFGPSWAHFFLDSQAWPLHRDPALEAPQINAINTERPNAQLAFSAEEIREAEQRLCGIAYEGLFF